MFISHRYTYTKRENNTSLRLGAAGNDIENIHIVIWGFLLYHLSFFQAYVFLNRLTGTPIGLTAYGMFVVNKPTILTVSLLE